MKTTVLCLEAFAVLACLAGAAPAFADNSANASPDSSASREARWRDLEKAVFHDKTAGPANGLVSLEAPTRAEDASLVPMTITLKNPAQVKALYLIIDDNPSPVAAHFTFGPAADPHVTRLRVRVNSYTNVHAVAELQDGSLVEDAKFVKASGGCSAPMGEGDEEAMRGMGEMRLKFSGAAVPGAATQAVLMVRHPNFNGMQMNQVTHLYTPARYIDRITMKDGDRLVFDLETGISLSTNPVLTFSFVPHAQAQATVEVHDSENGSWNQAFAVPGTTN